MSVPYADLHLQYQTIKEDIDSAIAAVIRDSAFIRGTYVDAFESAFAAAMEAKHCVSCANGTDALFIAMAALGVEEGESNHYSALVDQHFGHDYACRRNSRLL